MTKEFLSVIIEALIVCRNCHENMVLHATPAPRARATVTGFPFTTKVFQQVITAVTSASPFPCSFSLPLSTPLILNGSTSSRSFKYANFNTKLGWRFATDWWYSIFTKFNRILYQPIHTCRMILVPLIQVSSDAEDSGTFAPPHFICAEMPQILEYYHSAEMV